jgi:hypothetical protein
MEHIYRAILAMPAFALKDGTKASVDQLAGPALNADGDLVCGFDVRLDNGGRLEFYLRNKRHEALRDQAARHGAIAGAGQLPPRRISARHRLAASEFVRAVDKLRAEATEPVQEVMEHVSKAILAMSESTLNGGTKARIDHLSSPELNPDRELACGFDAVLDNGTRQEFYLRHTGWVSPFLPEIDPKKPRPGRGR